MIVPTAKAIHYSYTYAKFPHLDLGVVLCPVLYQHTGFLATLDDVIHSIIAFFCDADRVITNPPNEKI